MPARTISTASITRDSSPPDAPRCSGRAGAPAWAISCSSTSSTPHGPKATRRPSSARPCGSSRWLTDDRERCVGHRQPSQLSRHRRLERGRGHGTGLRQRRGGRGELGEDLVAPGGQLLDPGVVVVERDQPLARLRRPREHAVEIDGVPAGQGAQPAQPLLDDRQPGRIGVEPVDVRRQVGRHVGEDVGRLGHPDRQRVQLGVVAADRVELVPDGAEQPEDIADLGSLRGAAQRVVGGAGGRPQRLDVAEAGRLGGQREILAELRRDLVDLGQPTAQALGLQGALPAVGRDVLELGADGRQLGEGGPVVGQRPGAARLPGVGVEHRALGRRTQQAALVGLAVDGDEVIGESGQGRDRDGAAAQVGARAAVRTDGAADQQLVAVEVTAGGLDLLGDNAARGRPGTCPRPPPER